MFSYGNAVQAIPSLGNLQSLKGRIGTNVISTFVRFLNLLFRCDIDVQIGNGRLNYINGYLSKDHDAVDVGLGEYVQRGSTAPWLATYRLLSKSSPGLPEVAIRMAHLSEFDKSFSHVLLFPPQPVSVLEIEGRKKNFSARMYGFFSDECRRLISSGEPLGQNFLTWHRSRQYDSQNDRISFRGGQHKRMHHDTQVVACRYWYELTDGYWGLLAVSDCLVFCYCKGLDGIFSPPDSIRAPVFPIQPDLIVDFSILTQYEPPWPRSRLHMSQSSKITRNIVLLHIPE